MFNLSSLTIQVHRRWLSLLCVGRAVSNHRERHQQQGNLVLLIGQSLEKNVSLFPTPSPSHTHSCLPPLELLGLQTNYSCFPCKRAFSLSFEEFLECLHKSMHPFASKLPFLIDPVPPPTPQIDRELLSPPTRNRPSHNS